MNLVSKVRLFISESGSIKYEIIRRLSRGRKHRILLNRTNPKYFNHTARRINAIMKQQEFTYLEIGVANGTTFQSVNASKKHGVDPYPLFNYEKLPANVTFDKKTSDHFFEMLGKSQKYDFIFLDGLHESNQLLRDLIHSLSHIELGGWILIDDVVPNDSISAIPDIDQSYKARGVSPKEGYPWHGDCFKILPIVLTALSNCAHYLIIYPDNPQLLIQVGRDQSKLDSEIAALKEVDLSNLILNYGSIFTHENLIKYPVYIEDPLLDELRKSGIIMA